LCARSFADWEREAFSTWWLDPEVEYEMVGGPAPQRGSGAEGLTAVMTDFGSDWSEYLITAVEWRQLDDGSVFVVSHVRACGRASGARIEQNRATLFQIRAGAVVRYVTWWDPARAFADLGLAPEGGPGP
jgi:ketosteroid isomerase-like protein